MVIRVELADPRHPDVRELLFSGHTAMQGLFPAKRQVPISIESLQTDGVHVFVARAEGRAVGCCALFLSGALAELKKLYVAPESRRQGTADQLVAHAEAFAKAAGFEELKLETGVTLSAAHRLYAKHGFTRCEAFGDHLPSSESQFMTKSLVKQAT